MTLIYELDLDIKYITLQIKNELYRSRLSKVRALQIDRQTDTDKSDLKHYHAALADGKDL